MRRNSLISECVCPVCGIPIRPPNFYEEHYGYDVYVDMNDVEVECDYEHTSYELCTREEFENHSMKVKLVTTNTGSYEGRLIILDEDEIMLIEATKLMNRNGSAPKKPRINGIIRFNKGYVSSMKSIDVVYANPFSF